MADIASVNKVIIVGRLGKDPEIQTNLNTDSKFTVLNVATNEYYKTSTGSKTKETWHRCIVWGKAAQNICRYATKGTLVAIDGKIERSVFETKDGGRRQSFEIKVNHITIIGGKIANVDEIPPDDEDDFKDEEEDKKDDPY